MSEDNLIIGGLEVQPGFYIDNYRYHSKVGFGGMAEVLLGYDPSNTPFAIKVLKANRFKAGRRRFSREFRTLSKMHHPNVIQVDSYGDIYGHPYIAMEYIKGTDLHKEIRQFRDLPLAERWVRVREILIDLSKGLAHIHSHGVVHRDLKPSNILIDESGRCIITDFGIVKELNSDVEKSTVLVGTWAYASPEQITGQELDHRSDLYSLGIILYAMLCSRRPFAASNMAGYSKLHSEQPPRPPSDFIQEIPTVYEEICLKLLSKSPQERYQSAQEILMDLGEVQGQKKAMASMVEQITFFKTDLPSDLLRMIQQRHQVAALLVGDEGFGKSRILSGLTNKLSNLHIPHIRIRLRKYPDPFEGGNALIQYIAKESGDEQLHLLWKQYGELSVADLGLQSKLLDRSTHLMRALLQERAQVILIDDLHFAQELSLRFFKQLWDRLAIQLNLPLFFFISSQQPIDIFEHGESVPLKLLSTQDIAEILQKMTSSEPSDDINTIAERIHSETDGVPLFLNAFIQQLLEERVLQKNGLHYAFRKSAHDIATQKFNIPPSIRDLVLNRINALSETERELVQWLSISDRELHLDTLINLVNLDDEVLFDTLDELIQRRMILERKAGIDEFFSLRRRNYVSVLYETMQPELRIQMHKSLAEHLETATSLHNIKAIQHLSHHFRCGQVSGKAYQYLSLAALRLWERGLLQSAMENVQHAHPLTKLAKKELSEDSFSKSRLQLLQVRSAMSRNQGEWKEALKHLKTQLRYAKSLKDWRVRLRTHLSIGGIHTRLGDTDKGIQFFEEVLQDSEHRGYLPTQIEAHYQLCATHWLRGNLKQALQNAKNGLALTIEGEQTLPRAKILLSISSLQAHLGQITTSCTQMEEAISILKVLRQKELLCIVLSNLAEVQIWRGMWLESTQNAQEGLQLSRENLYQIGQAQARLILAQSAFERGLYSKATHHAKEALRISVDIKIPALEAKTSFILAKIQLGLDNPKAALSFLKTARKILQENDPEQYKISVHLAMALTLFQLKRYETGHTIIKSIEPYIYKVPIARQLTNLYWLARCRQFSGEIPKAIETTHKAIHLSKQFDMLGWSVKLHSLLSSLSDDPKHHESWRQIFNQRTQEWPETERLLMLDHLQFMHD